MPSHNPAYKIRTSEHRAAGIALFRALLRACDAVPEISDNSREGLQNIVRNRFKRHKYVHSRRLLQQGFEAGYAAVNILRSSATSEASRERISYLLNNVNSQHIAPPRLSHKQAKLERAAKNRAAGRTYGLPHACTIWSRPRPEVKGIRRVPKLVITNGFPFLRVGKPQPKKLTNTIVRFYKRRQKEVTTRDRLKELVPIADAEDEWDQQILAMTTGGGDVEMKDFSVERKKDKGSAVKKETPLKSNKKKRKSDLDLDWISPDVDIDDSPSEQEIEEEQKTWGGTIRTSLKDATRAFFREHGEKKALAEKLLDIIAKERALAKKEKTRRNRAAAAAAAVAAATAAPSSETSSIHASTISDSAPSSASASTLQSASTVAKAESVHKGKQQQKQERKRKRKQKPEPAKKPLWRGILE